LTGEQIRRLFFRTRDGEPASKQAVNARLRKLVEAGYLMAFVLDLGRGAGPNVYTLGPNARTARKRIPRSGRADSGSVWHDLEVADFRVCLQEDLEASGGELVEWLGEPALQAVMPQRSWLVPDAFVHWRLPDREGAFMLEWDRGTESMPVLTKKILRYTDFWRTGSYRQAIPGLGLKPRLAVVLTSVARARRLISWLSELQTTTALPTTFIGMTADAAKRPLGESWWRSGTKALARIVD
jgi:hypothetical protein